MITGKHEYVSCLLAYFPAIVYYGFANIYIHLMKTDMQTAERVKLQIILDRDLDLEIRVKSAENRQTISDFVGEGLKYYLKNYAKIQRQIEKNKEPEY